MKTWQRSDRRDALLDGVRRRLQTRVTHELKLRRSERSFPEGRRIERVASARELEAVCVRATLDAGQLGAAVDHSATTCERLMRDLVGETWRRLV